MKVGGKHHLTLFADPFPYAKEHAQKATDEFMKSIGKYEESPEKPIPLVPVEADFAYFPFRHLSEGIVGGGSWKATDFSADGVLKRSMPLIENVTAYTNHNQYVGNEIGHVGPPMWTAGYRNGKGQEIPAGIDAPFVIDKVLHPQLVRKLSSPVPPIKSASVSVLFEWESSHEFEKDYDFYYHLGEMVDGSMVRRVAVDIEEYLESSLVWQGADPFAKLIKDGVLMGYNREQIGTFMRFSDDPLKDFYNSNKTFFIFDEKLNNSTLQFNKSGKTGPKTLPMEKELYEAIALSLSMQVKDITPDVLKKIKIVKAEDFAAYEKEKGELETVKKSVTDLTKERDDLAAEKTKLVTEKTDLAKFKAENEQFALDGKAALDTLRGEVKEMYSKFSKGAPDEAIVKEIESNDRVSLEAKYKLFAGGAYAQFGAACGKCGSTEINMRSSKEEDPEKHNFNKGGAGDEMSLAERATFGLEY